MTVFYIISLALAAVWTNVVLAQWWPIFLIPILVWVGVHLSVLYFNTQWRWLWLVSLAVWSLFWVTPLESIAFLAVFGAGGELYNYINKKYLPLGNHLIGLLPSLVILGISDIVYLLATSQDLGWYIIGQLLVTIVIIGIIIFFYDPKKETKKFI